MRSMFPKYRISAKNAEALQLNEPDKWVVAEDDLTARNSMLRRGHQFTADQIQRLVALAVMVELGIYRWSARAAMVTVNLPVQAEPALAMVGEPTEEVSDVEAPLA